MREKKRRKKRVSPSPGGGHLQTKERAASKRCRRGGMSGANGGKRPGSVTVCGRELNCREGREEKGKKETGEGGRGPVAGGESDRLRHGRAVDRNRESDRESLMKA